MSNTVIVCVQTAVLFDASVALYVLAMVNRLGQDPGVILSDTQFIVTPGQLSFAVTNIALGGGTCDAHCTVIFGGQVIVGGSLSFTVTVKLQVLVLLLPSVAVANTVFTPLLY